MIKRALLVAALVAVALPVSAPAQAAGVCTFEFDVVIEPGVSLEPKTTSFHSLEEGNVFQCQGTVAGSTITGPGTVFVNGTGGEVVPETCLGDVPFGGYLAFNLDTADGRTNFVGSFTGGRAGAGGAFQADWVKFFSSTAGVLAGTFQFLPADGQDCATTPVTRAHVTGQAALIESPV